MILRTKAGSMTACTERHWPAPDNGAAGEGQQGTHKGAEHD
jgi:hypothetical protein